MPRKSTGTVAWMFNPETGKMQWHARWSLGNGKRTPKYVPIAENIPEHDRAAALKDSERWAPIARAEAAKKAAAKGEPEAFALYQERWLEDRATRLASVKDDRARLRDHVIPFLAKVDVRVLTRDQVEEVRDALDAKVHNKKLSWKTAGNVWALLRKLCDDLANHRRRELRVRSDNPALGIKPPMRGAKRQKQYLYPSELLTFLRSPKPPRVWKVAVVLALYTYGRDGEVATLEWSDFDFEHGVLRITKARDRETGKAKTTKSGGTRRFSVEPNLLPLLRAMHKRARGKGKVFTFDATHLSRTFKRWLKAAGVSRAELLDDTDTSRSITWHDLRATAATWMAVRGDKPLVIRDRCGHAGFETTEIYIREADVVAEGFGEVFPPLPLKELLRGGEEPPATPNEGETGPVPSERAGAAPAAAPRVEGSPSKAPPTPEAPVSRQLPANCQRPISSRKVARTLRIRERDTGLEAATEFTIDGKNGSESTDPASGAIANADATDELNPGNSSWQMKSLATSPMTENAEDLEARIAELEAQIIELEAGILRAVANDAFDVASTLSRQLEARRAVLEPLRREAAGVIDLDTRRRR